MPTTNVKTLKKFDSKFANWMRIKSFGMISSSILLIGLVTTLIFMTENNLLKWSVCIIEILAWLVIFIYHSFSIYKSEEGISNKDLYQQLSELAIIANKQHIEMQANIEKKILESDKKNKNDSEKVVKKLDYIINNLVLRD